ncbi:hypothetical protein R1sor_020356 [Riccia sorocarpa]|uniref:EF-hand domain-containing protein n=1 Tax=Riccia sorocarpa TaxID=122646 RepID=A0ABD3ILF7_9MARC
MDHHSIISSKSKTPSPFLSVSLNHQPKLLLGDLLPSLFHMAPRFSSKIFPSPLLAAELQTLMREVRGKNISAAECAVMIRYLDSDGDGLITFTEFQKLMTSTFISSNFRYDAPVPGFDGYRKEVSKDVSLGHILQTAQVTSALHVIIDLNCEGFQLHIAPRANTMKEAARRNLSFSHEDLTAV